MPGISRVGVDVAGGTIVGDLAPTTFINGSHTVVLGAAVSSHGDSPHDNPIMIESSSSVFANGILVCREADKATCDHVASGSSNVFAG